MCPRDIIKGPRIPIPEDAWENVQREQGDRNVGDDPDEEEEGDEAGSEEGYEGFESQAECEHAKEVEHPEDKEAGVAESWGGGVSTVVERTNGMHTFCRKGGRTPC